MCMGGGTPRPAAREPEAPVAPTADLEERQKRRDRQRAASGTILTSGQGVQNGAATEQKTLLGS